MVFRYICEFPCDIIRSLFWSTVSNILPEPSVQVSKKSFSFYKNLRTGNIWVIVSAFLETINFNNQAIYNIKPR